MMSGGKRSELTLKTIVTEIYLTLKLVHTFQIQLIDKILR